MICVAGLSVALASGCSGGDASSRDAATVDLSGYSAAAAGCPPTSASVAVTNGLGRALIVEKDGVNSELAPGGSRGFAVSACAHPAAALELKTEAAGGVGQEYFSILIHSQAGNSSSAQLTCGPLREKSVALASADEAQTVRCGVLALEVDDKGKAGWQLAVQEWPASK